MQKPPFTVCEDSLIFFENITCPLKCLFSAKHHVLSHKTTPRKKNHVTQLCFLKKPETSPSGVRSLKVGITDKC